MNGEQQNTEGAQPQQDTIPPADPVTPQTALPQEIQEGKTFAILTYALSLIGLPFFLVPLIMRNNEFSLYHAKQCLMIWIGFIAVGFISGVLSWTCIVPILGVAVLIFLFVLDIMGLINAVKGLQQPLPVIGKWAEDWFKSITKQA